MAGTQTKDGNGRDWRLALTILALVGGFVAWAIAQGHTYVDIERYHSDIGRIERSLTRVEEKIDRVEGKVDYLREAK